MLSVETKKLSRQYKGQRNNAPDHFQTDPVALDVLVPFLNKKWTIWECAEGKGNLVRSLYDRGFGNVYGTDIKCEWPDGVDFLTDKIWQRDADAIVTNPPYSLKDEFLERCYDLGKPFALLLPLTTFDSKKRRLLFKKHGIEIIFLPKRVNFETPNGAGSSAWFATAWFTNGLNIGQQLTFSDEVAA